MPTDKEKEAQEKPHKKNAPIDKRADQKAK